MSGQDAKRPGGPNDSQNNGPNNGQDNGHTYEQLYPEHVRPTPEAEDDHSDTDFDINAEIEAKLGKAGADEPSPRPEPLPDAEYAAAAVLDDIDPEDVRPCLEHEDDHSTTDFDLNGDIAKRAAQAEAASAALAAEVPYPEDVRPCPDQEDELCGTDMDVDAEIERQLGPATPADDDVSVEGAEHMHPGLAAALSASMRYAKYGLTDESGPDEAQRLEASRNVEGLGVDDDGPSPVEPEDSGEGDDPPLAGEFEQPSAAADNDPAPDGDAAPDSGAGGPGGPDDPDDDEEEEDEEEEKEEEEEEEEEGDDEEDDDDRPMTLRDHFRDLRKRLFRSFLWLILAFFCCYPFAEQLFGWLMQPLVDVLPSKSNFIYTSPPEAFFTYLKVSLVAAFFAASPMIFYQVWAFVAPGLYKEEKLYILPIAFFSALFFIGGGSFCYFIVFPFAFEFFMSYNTGLIQAMPALSESLSFVLKLLLAFGLVFEMPLFSFFLSRLGLLTADMMRRFRRYAIIAMFIVAAILTPPDVLSQLLMAGPLLVLYEVSILIAVIFGKKKPKPEEDEDEEEDEEEEETPARE